MIRVEGFGSRVPKAVQDEVVARQKDIASGKLQPFAARVAVLDNEGHVVIPAGTRLSDAQIQTMNYLVAGVQGKAGQ
jgi:simple sugar transport system substrate-binding protein